MANLLNLLNEIAEQYATHRNIQLHNLLGYGNDGAVWETNENSAIKVLMRQDSYDRELAAYIRLQERKVTNIGDYSIPELLGFDDTRLVIEMSVVSPPFVIDFAKSYVDSQPDYPQEAMDDWLASTEELFSEFGWEYWEDVQSILQVLRSVGIHYFDARTAIDALKL
jgi:hypothetical protein